MSYWVITNRTDIDDQYNSKPLKTLKEANAAASRTWQYLTPEEKSKNRVFVVRAPKDSDGDLDWAGYENSGKKGDPKNAFDSDLPYQGLDWGNYIVRDRQAGNLIDGFKTVAEAKKALAAYEEEDKENDEYEDNFYEIAKRDKNGSYSSYVPSSSRRVPKLGYKMPTQSQLNNGFRR